MNDSIPQTLTPKQDLEMLKSLPLEDMVNNLASKTVDFIIHLVVAVIVFYIGRFVIRKLYKLVATVLIHRQVDKSLTTFVLSLVNILLYFILIVTVIGILGLETSSFLAIFASAGVAIGMALSGTLQNFAGGVLILLLKPYKIGDYIEAQGYAGTVKEIQIFHTIIVTFDNKAIIIPNGGLSTGSINNWNREEYRRVDWEISISYGNEIRPARNLIKQMLLDDPRVVSTTIEEHRERSEAAAAATADVDATETATDDENAAEKTKKKPSVLQWLHRKRKDRMEHLYNQHKAKVEAFAPRVDRAPTVVLSAMADSAVVLKVRAWTRTTDYWQLFYDMNEKFYTELHNAGVSFPFPQLDVHFDKPIYVSKTPSSDIQP